MFVSHMKTYQKVTAEEEDFNSQVGTIPWSVGTSQPLSQPPSSLPSGLLSTVANVAGMDFPPQGWPGYGHC